MADVADGGGAWPGEGTVLVGRYRLVEFVAYGGAAALWRAHDTRLDREVAVKVLLPHHHYDETGAARFLREALAIAHVRHPNVVQIFDVVQNDGVSFLVMEYVNGPVLSEFQGHSLDSEVAAALGCQVASALGAAHDHDLVHRDVKPGNIVMEPVTGRAKLLDFGIAKDLRDTIGVTGPHRVVATTRYAAPEQLSDRPVGPWTDVYCLGLVLWELCAGRPAFQGRTEPATALMRLEDGPPPLREWVNDVPDALDQAVRRATRRDRRDRYPHGGRMAEALSELCGPRPHELTRRLTSRPSRPRRKAPSSTTAPWR